MAFHHVGVMVKSIDLGVAAYRALGGKISAPIQISSQGVRVCFVEVGGGALIELGKL
jgi:hypothetical protein